MSALKAGDAFPEGVAFSYIPPSPETTEFSQCGIPIKYDASKGKLLLHARVEHARPPFSQNLVPHTDELSLTELKEKKVVIVSVPGAFTPTCSAAHVPSYLANIDQLKAKGVDNIVFIAYNDPYVMSGWGKANGIKDEYIVSPPPARRSLYFFVFKFNMLTTQS